jgi:hypothetical protein
LPRVALIAAGVCALAAGAIYAAATSGPEQSAPAALPPAAAAPPAKPAPSAATPIENAKVAAQGEGAATAPAQTPDMVFTPESVGASELPQVKLQVRSEPSGAMVTLRGTRMGATPLTFDWRSIHARQGRELAIVLQLEGYEPYTIRRPIDGPELKLSAKLEPIAAEATTDDPELPALEPPPEPPQLDIRPKLAVPEHEATVPEPELP